MFSESSIAKNTLYITIASIGQKVLAFIYITLIARFLEIEEMGIYLFALSFTTIFSIFVEAGFNPVLIRQVAQDKNRAQKILENTLGSKTVLSLLSAIAVIAIISMLETNPVARNLVYAAVVVMILDSFHLNFYGVLRGFQILKYEAWGIVLGQLVTITIGTLILIAHLPILVLMAALGLGSLFNVVYSATLMKRTTGIIPRFALEIPYIKMIVKMALPFALAGLFVKVYSYADSVLLRYLADERAVAIYSIPYKLTFAFQFIPIAFIAALYPAMSSVHVSSKERLARLFERSINYLIILVLPLVIGIWVLSDKIILALYGTEYTSSILVLQILVASLIFVFLDFPIGSLFNASHKQNIQTLIKGVVMIINIVLNIILIPKYTFIGASIVALISFLLLFVGGLIWVPRIISIRWNLIIITTLKTIFASTLMGLAIYLLKSFINFIILIPLGMIIFILLIIATRTLTYQEIQSLLSIFLRKNKIKIPVNG